MRKNDMTLRLSMKGREELLKNMKEMGGEFTRTAKRIEAGSKDANAGIKSVNAAAKEGRGALEGMAQQGGILGRVLKDIGPGGLALGASIGVATLALSGAMRVAREAVKAFDEIGKSADTLQLSTDLLQSLKAAAADEGVAVTDLEGAVRSLTKAHSDLVLGSGELYTRLKDTNPELLEQLRLTTSNDERLRLITGALQGTASATEKANIAYAAFGESGLGVARMLDRQQGGIDVMIDKYREMGLVVREDVIRNAEDMETKFGVAAQVIDLQLKQAFIDLAPVVLQSAQAMADVATWLSEILEVTKQLENRSTARLQRDRLWSGQTLAATRWISAEAVNNAMRTGEDLDVSNLTKSQFNRLRGHIETFNEANRVLSVRAEKERVAEVGNIRRGMTLEQLKEEQAALRDHLEQMGQITAEQRKRGEISLVEDPFAADRGRVQAELAAVEAELSRRAGMPVSKRPEDEAAAKARETELNRMRTEAVALLKQLGDYTAYVATETARYQKLLDEGLITPKQYEAAVKSLTDEVDGTTKALELWKGVVEASRTPVEVLEAQMDQLDADFAAGRVEIDLYRKAMEALRTEMAAAKQAETESRPGYKSAEAILADLDKAAADALTPAEKLRRETERVNALVASNDLDPAKATEWLALYKKRLDEAADATGFLALQERLLDAAQTGRIRTVGDLRRAISDWLVDMVAQYLQAKQQMKGGSFIDFLMGAGGAGGNPFSFGGWGGGGSSGGGGMGGIFSGLFSFFGQSHSGGSGASPPQIRSPRSSIGRNERLVVVEDTQTILTQSGRMNIAGDIAAMANERAAISGLIQRALTASAPASAAPKVTINNFAGAQVETSQREGPDGPELSIDIRGELRNMVRGGAIDGPMRERYGVKPKGQ